MYYIPALFTLLILSCSFLILSVGLHLVMFGGLKVFFGLHDVQHGYYVLMYGLIAHTVSKILIEHRALF